MILYLIPTFLGETESSEVLPQKVTEVINQLDFFVVENLRTARRHLRRMGFTGVFDDITMLELNEHSAEADVSPIFAQALAANKNIGLMSEAGVPGVADPGANLVALAHQKGVKVVPLTGPSSILMALMASGLNGQRFAFNGYLPTDKNERQQKMKIYEKRSMNESQTQIFIETPYRNQALFADLIATLQPNTRLCVACSITEADEFICTLPVSEWHKKTPDIHKRPAIFLFLA
jgi:16S rRNA (cytidine1402-2'-O)-methyltransferase